MKNATLLFAMLVVAATTFAGDLQPPSSPAPTMKTLGEVEPRIPISDATTPGNSFCKYKITQPGSYYLTGNFTINYRHGILIDASDVKIDLMGYKVNSSWAVAPPGVNLDFDGIAILGGNKNIEIKNGSIVSNNTQTTAICYRGFRNGIAGLYSPYATDITIDNVNVFNSRANGIFIVGDRAKVEGCRVVGNGKNAGGSYANAIRVGRSSEVIDNFISGNGESATATVCGIWTGESSTISGNRVENNALSAVGTVYAISASYKAVISNNIVAGNAEEAQGEVYGIRAIDDLIISDNVISFNGSDAKKLVYGISAGYRCRIAGNTVNQNGYSASKSAIGIDTKSYCLITDNCVCSNGSSSEELGYGVKVTNCCLIDRNTIAANHGDNLNNGSSCTIGTNMAP